MKKILFQLKMWKITTPPQVTCWNIQNPELKNMICPFLKTAPCMRILKSLGLSRNQELYKKVLNHNLNRWLKICKRRYTKGSVNNQNVQKLAQVLDGNFSVKNALNISTKYLQDQICRIKRIKNIEVTWRTFSNLLKTFQKNLRIKRTPQNRPYLKF